MLVIYVDADSCPVKEEIVRVATRYNLEVFIVSNKYLRLNFGSKVKMIVVGSGFDEADNWIEKHIGCNDIAITSDILLASRCINKQAVVISPSGKVFDAGNIGMKVAMRELNSHLRESGEISSYNHSFTQRDRSCFLVMLDNSIQKIKRL